MTDRPKDFDVCVSLVTVRTILASRYGSITFITSELARILSTLGTKVFSGITILSVSWCRVNGRPLCTDLEEPLWGRDSDGAY